MLSISDLPENVDGDGETLTFVLTEAEETTPEGGSVRIDDDGNLNYTPPDETFTGTDTLTYSVSDAIGEDSTGTLTIEVLDLTQRNISVRFSNNQGNTVASAVRLTGTDALGNTVTESPTINDGELFFENVLPGDYMVEIPALPFFTGGDAPQQYTINSAPEDGDAVVEATMGRIKPEFLSLQDWLGSTPKESALVVISPGESALLTEPTSDASNSINNPVIALNETGTELTITGEDEDEDPSDDTPPPTLDASVLTTQGDIVKERGQIGDLRLYRVNLADTVVTYNSTDQEAPSTQGGEGEGVAVEEATSSEIVSNAIVENDSSAGGLTAEGSGEGESIADSTSVTEVSAPLLSAASLASNVQSDSEDQHDTDRHRTGGNTVAVASPILFFDDVEYGRLHVQHRRFSSGGRHGESVRAS